MLCSKCGAFFSLQSPPPGVIVRCHKCDDHHYDAAWATGIYEKALASAVISLKSEPYLPRALRHQIERRVRSKAQGEYDLLIPVPLSKMRALERGFNQAEILAGVVSGILKTPVDALSLARVKHTPLHRVGMDERARELTVQKAFDVVRPKLIAGKRVLLVDDVFTSGATASYSARALKRAGAATVDVFTLARAVLR